MLTSGVLRSNIFWEGSRPQPTGGRLLLTTGNQSGDKNPSCQFHQVSHSQIRQTHDNSPDGSALNALTKPATMYARSSGVLNLSNKFD